MKIIQNARDWFLRQAILNQLDELNEQVFTISGRVTHMLDVVQSIATGVAQLAANVSSLATNITTNDAAIQAEILEVKTLLASQTGLSPEDAASLAASLDTISGLNTTIAAQAATIAGESAALTGSLPVTPPPAPVPTP